MASPTNAKRLRDRVRNRVRKSRFRRGAAFIEAIVAIPFFILIFAATMFMGRLYNDKLKTLRQSREAAWATASAGCEGQNGGEPLPEAAGADLGEAQGAPGTEMLAEGFGNASTTMTAKVNAGGVLGAWGVTVKSTTVVACNEKRRDTTPWSIVSYVWNVFKP